MHVHQTGHEGRHRHFSHVAVPQLSVIPIAERVNLKDRSIAPEIVEVLSRENESAYADALKGQEDISGRVFFGAELQNR